MVAPAFNRWSRTSEGARLGQQRAGRSSRPVESRELSARKTPGERTVSKSSSSAVPRRCTSSVSNARAAIRAGSRSRARIRRAEHVFAKEGGVVSRQKLALRRGQGGRPRCNGELGVAVGQREEGAPTALPELERVQAEAGDQTVAGDRLKRRSSARGVRGAALPLAPPDRAAHPRADLRHAARRTRAQSRSRERTSGRARSGMSAPTSSGSLRQRAQGEPQRGYGLRSATRRPRRRRDRRAAMVRRRAGRRQHEGGRWIQVNPSKARDDGEVRERLLCGGREIFPARAAGPLRAPRT